LKLFKFKENILFWLRKISNLPNYKKTALFESVPFWLVHELKEEKRTLCSIVEQYEKINHIEEIFLNSKFYLVDDLMDEFWKLKSDFIVNASCLIFYKVK